MSQLPAGKYQAPQAVHHVTVLSRHASVVIEFLVDAIGLPVVARHETAQDVVAGLYAWPPRDAQIKSTVVGRLSECFVEVVDASGEVGRLAESAQPTAPVTLLSFVVSDLDGILRRAAAIATKVIRGPQSIPLGRSSVAVAVVQVGDIAVQLAQT
jgi:hypothetical protein